MKISILKIVEDTIVDGPGLRTSIYCAGCVNRCFGCHNPQSWDINHGTMTDVDEIFETICQYDFNNITFTGGDPMYQALAFAELAKKIKAETSKNIWCYTGYTFEQILESPEKRELLNYVDVLVDGKFDIAQRDENLLFRGSRNQRLIDVQASLQQGKVVEYIYNPMPSFVGLKDFATA